LFVAVALWMLKPDEPTAKAGEAVGRLGPFGLTTIAFSLAELGARPRSPP
jgi:putative Ca2+/H+ antiporter (TMEM165/GDT1 family)